jgi:hypothetical protein
MSRTYVPAELRRTVLKRAGGHCEYCLFPQAFAFLTFEVEHIVAAKHGGLTLADNLALACSYCNRYKGSDPGSFDPETGQLVPFYHPRRQQWADHFRIEGAQIVPLTAEGRVTVAILQFNNHDRILERQQLLDAGAYPYAMI